jgi:hypothetical protein
MGQSDDLLHGIREKILAGDLPKQNCRMTWYGGGTGGRISGRSTGRPRTSAGAPAPS